MGKAQTADLAIDREYEKNMALFDQMNASAEIEGLETVAEARAIQERVARGEISADEAIELVFQRCDELKGGGGPRL